LNDALGLLETIGLTPTLAALDAMEKCAKVSLVQCELNDYCGVCTKITGSVSAVNAAIEAGCRVAKRMGCQVVAHVIQHPDTQSRKEIVSLREFNPLIEQDVVFFPNFQPAAESPDNKRLPMNRESTFALGLIETQGFTAVFEALDTACKAANVKVVGKEKLGGGYVTVIIKGDLSAVTAAIEAGQTKVAGLGKLIAAHVLAHPSDAVLSLLPK
jgi:microcompartment protein CcmL/EutN